MEERLRHTEIRDGRGVVWVNERQWAALFPSHSGLDTTRS